MTDSTWNQGNGRPAQRGLNQALDRVLDPCRPVEVILFGSAARGELHDGSDIELLVVLADGDPGEPWRTGLAVSDAIVYEPPVNIRVAVERGVRKAARRLASALRTLKEGGVLCRCGPRLAYARRRRPAPATGERCADPVAKMSNRRQAPGAGRDSRSVPDPDLPGNRRRRGRNACHRGFGPRCGSALRRRSPYGRQGVAVVPGSARTGLKVWTHAGPQAWSIRRVVRPVGGVFGLVPPFAYCRVVVPGSGSVGSPDRVRVSTSSWPRIMATSPGEGVHSRVHAVDAGVEAVDAGDDPGGGAEQGQDDRH